MNREDSRRLERIITARFDRLQTELAQRRMEARQIIRDNMLTESDGQIATFQAKVDELRKRAKQLSRDEEDLLHEIAVVGLAYSSTHIVSVRWDEGVRVEPKGLTERVKSEIDRLEVEVGSGKANLVAMREDLIVSLLTDQLESSDAKDFLQRIPTVDALLPMPERKALSA